MKSSSEKTYPLFNIAKFLLVLCFIAMNTTVFGETGVAYYLYTMICKITIPFFLLSSGYFLADKVTKDNHDIVLKDFLKKTGKLYILLATFGLAITLVKTNDLSLLNFLSKIWQITTFSPSDLSWVMGSLFASGIIIYFINNKKLFRSVLRLFLILFIIGLAFNTYSYFIINHNFKELYEFFHTTFNNNTNFLFSGFFFFGLGYYLNLYCQKQIKKPRYVWYICLLMGFILLFFESRYLSQYLSVTPNYDYFFAHLLIIPTLFVLIITSKINNVINFNTNLIGNISAYIFYISGYVLDLLFIYQVYRLGSIFDYRIVMFLGVFIISLLLAICLMFVIKKKGWNRETVLSFSLIISSIIMLIFSLIILINKSIWADEACSVAMLKHSLLGIIKLNANDVHPPLYYLLLRIFLPVIKFIFPSMSLIEGAKLFSFVPLVILAVYSFTKIRREYGFLIASIFFFFIVGMPSMMQYYGEARMYSFAMCFTTVAFIYMADVLRNNDKKSWLKFVIFSILAAYSHLYACLCIVILFIFLFFVSLARKEREFFRKWFISGLITFVLYLPWIIVILIQLKKVSDGFWIPEITMGDVIGYFRFIFHGETLDYASGSILGITLIFITWFALAKHLFSKESRTTKAYSCIGIAMPFIVMAIGIIVSLLVTPLFVGRYLFPSLGCIWLIMAILLGNLVKNKESVCILFIIFLLSATANVNHLLRYESSMINNEKFYQNYQDTIPEDALIVSDYTHMQMVDAYYHPDKTIYCYKCHNNKMINQLFGNIQDDITIDDIVNFVNEGKTIYFIRAEFDNNYLPLFIEHGIHYELSNILYEDWYGMQMIILRH